MLQMMSSIFMTSLLRNIGLLIRITVMMPGQNFSILELPIDYIILPQSTAFDAGDKVLRLCYSGGEREHYESFHL